MLKALYDLFPEEVKQSIRDTVFQILFYKRDYTSPDYKEIKIEHSQVDIDAYQKVIKNSENIDLAHINEDDSKILRCYKFFIEKLSKVDEEKRKELLNKLLKPENKMLVVIDLDEKDDEQIIFDVLNTAEVRLTSSEIIKNALFKRAIELIRKEDAIELYKNMGIDVFTR